MLIHIHGSFIDQSIDVETINVALLVVLIFDCALDVIIQLVECVGDDFTSGSHQGQDLDPLVVGFLNELAFGRE
jgi:hypothetical protein